MGKVQLYEQGTLPSKAVGTPGVSNAGEYDIQMGESIGQLTQQFITIEKAKNEIAADIASERAVIDYETQLTAKQQELQNQYAGDPDVAVAVFNKIASDTQEQIKSKFSDPKTASKFELKTPLINQEYHGKLAKWSSAQKMQNVLFDVDQGVTQLVSQAGGLGNSEDFFKLTARISQFTGNAAVVIGGDNAAKLRDTAVKESASTFLYNMMENNSQEARRALDQQLLSSYLTPQQLHSARKELDALDDKRKKEELDSARLTWGLTVSHTVNKFVDGNVSLKELNDLIAALGRDVAKGTATQSQLNAVISVKKQYVNKQESEEKAEDRQAHSGTSRGHGVSNAVGKSQKAVEVRNAKVTAAIDLNNKFARVFTGSKINKSTTISELNELAAVATSYAMDGRIAPSQLRSVLKAVGVGLNTLKAKVNVRAKKQGGGGFLGLGDSIADAYMPREHANIIKAELSAWVNQNFRDPKKRNQVFNELTFAAIDRYDEAVKRKKFTSKAYARQIIIAAKKKYGVR